MATSKKAFITGCSGFVGNYLAAHLASLHWEVSGMDRWPACDIAGLSYHEGDILDTAALAEMLATVKPDRIFHLAGISFLPDADLSPRHALDINIMGAASALDAARQSCPSARILLVGSSKEYGDMPSSETIAETTPCRPTNFYGVSKYMAECIGMQYARQYGLDVRFTRSFNHTGPGQSPRFVCSDWTKQAAEIDLGRREARIQVGDVTPAIDITDVRDVVSAYHLILEKCAAGEAYNVCSGSAAALRDVLSLIQKKAKKPITIEQDDARLRLHTTSTRTVGDHNKLTAATGWMPKIPLEKTLDDLYRYWIAKLSSPPQA